MKLLQLLRSVALVVGAGTLAASPLVALYWYAEAQDPAARERLIAQRYSDSGYSTGSSSSAAYRDSSPEVETEIPLGCWKLETLSSTERPQLLASWLADCPVAGNPTLSEGEYPLPTVPVYLSAWGDGQPRMGWAHAYGEFDENLSDTDGTQAALLYLPATKDGQGYYVAGWSQLNSVGDLEQGLKIGHYGAPPASVVTSAGRVYLEAPGTWGG